MKTHDYKCSVCGSEKFDYPANKRPPICCRKIMLRVFHPIGIHFKCDGFTGACKEKR